MYFALIVMFSHILLGGLWAQDNMLVGTWKGVYELDPENAEVLLRFDADGSLVYTQTILLQEEGADSLTVILEGVGTWRVEEDRIWMDVERITMEENVESLLIEFAKGFARFVADILGISDEDYPAFEQEAVAEFMAGWEESLEGFAVWGSYILDGDALTMDLSVEDEDSVLLQLYRVADTAVSSLTWGQVKERIRP